MQEWFTLYVAQRIAQLEDKRAQRWPTSSGGRWPAPEAGTSELAERMAAAVREHFGGYETWRALRVARTETAIRLQLRSKARGEASRLNARGRHRRDSNLLVSEGVRLADPIGARCDAMTNAHGQPGIARPLDHPT